MKKLSTFLEICIGGFYDMNKWLLDLETWSSKIWIRGFYDMDTWSYKYGYVVFMSKKP